MEDILNKWLKETPKDKFEKESHRYSYYDLLDFAEYYHSLQLLQTDVSGSYISEPNQPLSRYNREGTHILCSICGSTMPKSGFLMLFGKRYCDNAKCLNSKGFNN